MTSRLRSVFELVGGLAILGTLWAVLLTLPFSMLALAYAAHVIGAGLNIIWFAVVFGMLASGAYRRRLGSCAAS